MKKFSILLLAAALLASCGYKAKTITLENEADSINYAFGVYYSSFISDSTDEGIEEFLDAVKAGYKGELDDLAPTALLGMQLGLSAKSFETEGLFNQPQLTFNGEIFFQGLVNTWLGDTTTLPASQAQSLAQRVMMGQLPEEDLQYETVGIKKCPSELAKVELKNLMDSVNYALAVLQGGQWKTMLEQADTITPADQMTNTLVENINKGLKTKIYSPETYLGGRQFGSMIKKWEEENKGLGDFEDIEVKFDIIFQGLINGANEYEEMMNREEAGKYLNDLANEREFGEWRRENEKWLADNAKKDSVQTTPSGLQYKVLKEGQGEKPTAIDTVKVHYEGRLINDTIFDSSYRRKEPVSFPLNGVIAGWTEGLQLMSPGAEYMFYIPQQLGYGERNTGGMIQPFSTLIFRVQLLEVKKAQPQTQPAEQDVQLQMID